MSMRPVPAASMGPGSSSPSPRRRSDRMPHLPTRRTKPRPGTPAPSASAAAPTNSPTPVSAASFALSPVAARFRRAHAEASRRHRSSSPRSCASNCVRSLASAWNGVPARKAQPIPSHIHDGSASSAGETCSGKMRLRRPSGVSSDAVPSGATASKIELGQYAPASWRSAASRRNSSWRRRVLPHPEGASSETHRGTCVETTWSNVASRRSTTATRSAPTNGLSRSSAATIGHRTAGPDTASQIGDQVSRAAATRSVHQLKWRVAEARASSPRPRTTSNTWCGPSCTIPPMSARWNAVRRSGLRTAPESRR